MSQKKTKTKVIYKQSFSEDYSKRWPFIVKGLLPHHARCTLCSVDISISHGGSNDISKHIATQKHTHMSRKSATTTDIRDMFPKVGDKAHTRAEALMCEFLIEHNLPLAVSDHLTALIKAAVPDSQIAKITCGRTKTSYIVKVS